MKRDEMIRIMQNAWKDYMLNVMDTSEVGTYAGMSEVLDAIEKAGMLPPEKAMYYSQFVTLKDHVSDLSPIVRGWDDE